MPGGRPKKEINQKQFESLCAIQCTEEEICAVLDVSDKTLARWCRDTYKMKFSEVFREKRAGGKASLRKSQWALAQTNPTMAIWLGKQYLGQKDKQEEENTIERFIKNMETLADVIGRPVPDRNIEDLENEHSGTADE